MYFHKFAQKGSAFIKEVATELGYPDDLSRAVRVTKAVLHALRDRISPAESVQLIAQLPLYIKALYVDGWRITDRHTKVRNLADFLALVDRRGAGATDRDFYNEVDIRHAVTAVFNVLKRHVSEGEIEDIRQGMPRQLVDLF